MEKKFFKYTETNDNKNMTTQNLWDTAKAVLRGKFVAIQSHLMKHKNLKQSNPTIKTIRERRTKKTQSQ